MIETIIHINRARQYEFLGHTDTDILNNKFKIKDFLKSKTSKENPINIIFIKLETLSSWKILNVVYFYNTNTLLALNYNLKFWTKPLKPNK